MAKKKVNKKTANFNNIVGQLFSGFLNQFTDLFVNLPSIMLKFAVFLFTFFFAIRDSKTLSSYITKLSPFSKKMEIKIMTEFRGITNAIVFGQVLVGVIQGLALGIGVFILRIPNALTLTFIACLVSIIPLIGAWGVWAPVSAYLLINGQIFSGIFLALYGFFFVSTIDNFLRPYILSRRTSLALPVSIIGTIGGLYFFGIAGLLLGPLILAYALIIIEFYQKGRLNELFQKNEVKG
jgi:predicted PurR-regulated permease PerM